MGNNTSGQNGIRFYLPTNKWVARITVNKVLKHIGYYETLEEAVLTRDQYIIDNKLPRRNFFSMPNLSKFFSSDKTFLVSKLLTEQFKVNIEFDSKIKQEESFDSDMNVFQQLSFALILVIDELIEEGILSEECEQKINSVFNGELKEIIDVVTKGPKKDNFKQY